MNIRLIVCVMLFFELFTAKILCSQPDTLTTEILFPLRNSPVAVVNRKFEVGIDFPDEFRQRIFRYVNMVRGEQINPFDVQQIDVMAEFKHVKSTGDTLLIHVPAFFFRDFNRVIRNTADITLKGQYWEPLKTPYPFRVRFSPPEAGDWTYKIIARFNGVYGKHEFVSSVGSFHAGKGDAPGRLSINESKKYFIDNASGKIFFPVGQNLPWPEYGDDAYRRELTPPVGFLKYHTYMAALKRAGGNYFRILIAPWNLEVEYEELGNYTQRMHCVWELDKIVDLAEKLDLRVHLNLQVHYPFENPNPYVMTWWDWSKYKDAGYGTCPTSPEDAGYCYRNELNIENPVDFLINEDAKRHYKNRLRYYVARYGYSTNIALFELLSEANNLGQQVFLQYDEAGERGAGCYLDKNKGFYKPYSKPEVARNLGKWQAEMCSYLKGLEVPQLTAVNYTGSPDLVNDSSFYSAAVDVVTYNRYQASPDKPWFILFDRRDLFDVKNIKKPMMHSEIGNGDGIMDNDANTGWILDAWVSGLTGLSGIALNWTNSRDTVLWQHYGRISNFYEPADFSAGNWVSSWYDSKKGGYAFVSMIADYKADHLVALGLAGNKTWNFFTKGKEGTNAREPLLKYGPERYYNQQNISTRKGKELQIAGAGKWRTRYKIEWIDPFTGKIVAESQEKVRCNGKVRLKHPVLGVSEDAANKPFYVFRIYHAGL